MRIFLKVFNRRCLKEDIMLFMFCFEDRFNRQIIEIANREKEL